MLWICNDCTTAYSVDAPRCPHCGSTDYVEEGAVLLDESEAKAAEEAPED